MTYRTSDHFASLIIFVETPRARSALARIAAAGAMRFNMRFAENAKGFAAVSARSGIVARRL